ncbi:MAG: 4Fe-4S binding protein [Actinomycetota bacterium]|nr:4Fe-4S binding protein [Actinomycetota bacterium]
MPWVDKDECSGCGVCVEECPLDTIHMEDDAAETDMDGCIRCGTCHDVCPEGAVRHDSELIPGEVSANVARTREFTSACVQHLGSKEEGRKCLNRMIKLFNKQKTVAEKTLEELEKIRQAS